MPHSLLGHCRVWYRYSLAHVVMQFELNHRLGGLQLQRRCVYIIISAVRRLRCFYNGAKKVWVSRWLRLYSFWHYLGQCFARVLSSTSMAPRIFGRKIRGILLMLKLLITILEWRPSTRACCSQPLQYICLTASTGSLSPRFCLLFSNFEFLIDLRWGYPTGPLVIVLSISGASQGGRQGHQQQSKKKRTKMQT